MRLTRRQAADSSLVLEWMASERMGRQRKWDKRLCAYRRCMKRGHCQFRQVFAGTTLFYCKAPDSFECMHGRHDWKPGGVQHFRADLCASEPIRFRRDQRTREVLDAWRVMLNEAFTEGGIVGCAANAYRYGEWGPYLAICASVHPKDDRNEAVVRAHHILASYVAAGADAMFSKEGSRA